MSTAQNENSHSTSPKYIELAFKYLPAYAQFLLTHHLEEFARSSLRVSRELQIPLLKYFEAMPEEVLVELSIQGNKEMLEYFSQNRVQAFIDKSIQSWLENQLPLIHYDEVVVEDITLVSFVRRKIFRDFLPLYSPDIETYIKVMEEMDKFSVHLEESCFKTLFDLKQKKINEHHHFIDKINNTSPGITYVFDLLEQKEVYSNHKREELLGYTEADLKEMGSDVLSQILHEEDLSQAYTNQLKFSSADDGEMFTHEYRVRNKKGEFRWHRTYETIFKRSDAGVPTQIIGIAIDISQEKEAASQLEQSEHRLSEAQEIAGMGSFEWNLSGGTSVFSTQLLKIFALPQPGNLLSFLEDVHPSDRPKVRQAIEAAISGNGHYECEYRYGAGDTEKVIWSRGLVIFEDGKPIKMKGTVMDVTQRHHMLKRLERSEELHKQAQALTHIGNWTWSVSDNKITWSDEMYRIYGLEPQSETISFDRFLSFIHPEDRQKRSDEIQRALHTHIAEDYTMRIISADGTSKILQGKGEVLVDEAGQPYKLVGTCQDVTKQALLHQRLKENEAAFRQLIANAPDAVIVIDENSKVVLWNPKSESLFGWSAEEIIGKSLMETIIPQAYRAGHLLGVKRMHETGEARVLNKTIEITALKKNGEEFYIALSIARSLWAGEEVFISFIRDISKEKQIEMELEKQRNELTQKNIALERSNEELTAFNYIASHDLKEPARKIKIFSSRVLDKSKHELAADVEDSLQRIAAASDHMLNLIDALLTFSRVTSGEQAQERTDLNILLQAVLLSLKETIEEKQAVIESTPLPTAKVIAFQFQQLFENIIGNALKYSKTDTAPQIRISCALVPGGQLNMEDADLARSYYALSIADNGIGFDQKYEHKIFDLFQRLHHKNEYSGTGIGLAICKKVVQNHHGFIITRSVPGEGTTFTIYIPV